MKPTESKSRGGGRKTGKRPWSKPRIREMAIAAGTRSGPFSNTFETSNYNFGSLDCGLYPQICANYGIS